MRNFVKYILCIMLCLCFAGCADTRMPNLTEHQKSITGVSAVWEMAEREYSADIELGENTDGDSIPARVTVTSPENISRMTVTYSAEGAVASVGDVSFTLPENMGREVYRIIKCLYLDSEDRKGAGSGTGISVLYECEMFGSTTAFDVTYGEDKYPRTAKITWDDGEMTVEYGYISVAK